MISKEQTSDFIVGYIFSHIDNDMKKMASSQDLSEISKRLRIPKVWFGLPCTTNHTVTLCDYDKVSYSDKLYRVAGELTPRQLCFDSVKISPDLQYILFEYRIHRKKKMTISQIEAKLGYEIEIVKES